MQRSRLRLLGLGLLVVGACASSSSPSSAPERLGSFTAQDCPAGTQFHRSEKYWEEFATWPAQWCARPDGTRHGPWTEWHEDGHVRRIGLYVDGAPEGRWLVWTKPPWWRRLWSDTYEKIELKYSHGVLVRADRVGS